MDQKNQGSNVGQQGQYPDFNEFRNRIRTSGVKDQASYRDFARKNNLPEHPDQQYQGQGWTSWDSLFTDGSGDQQNTSSGTRSGNI